MIDFFPIIYDDESIYHSIARFKYYHFPNASTHDISRILTDGVGTNPNLMLMDRLGVIAQQLTPAYSFEDLLYHHSAYPFTAPFLTKKQQDKIMLSQQGLIQPYQVSRSLSRRKLGVKIPRYCSSCAQKDMELYGEAFMHVSHNLPGIWACSKHGQLLREYPVSKSQASYNYIYFDQNKLIFEPNALAPESEIKIARLSYQLLELDPSLELDAEVMAGKLVRLLSQAGRMSGKRIDYSGLWEDLCAYYPIEVLERLKMPAFDVDVQKQSWMTKMIQPPHIAPIAWWIAVIARYTDSIDDFLALEPLKPVTSSKAKVAGSWPCLNKACSHYGDDVIRFGLRSPSRYETLLRCPHCNMVYSHVRSDTGHEITYVEQYGRVWYEKLEDLLSQNLSPQEIADALGVTVEQLERLSQASDPTPVDTAIKSAKESVQTFLETHPKAKLREVKNQQTSSLSVLRRYDLEEMNSVLSSCSR